MNPSVKHCLKIYEDPDFYDTEFSDRTHDTSFYIDQAIALGGPILELGCGTGRITQPIADRKIEIHGIDISQPMLALARKRKGSENILYFHSDMVDFNLETSYTLVFAATNAIQHVLNKNDILKCLRAIRKSLRDDGTVIVDIFNPNVSKLARTWEQRYLFKNFISPSYGEIDVFARSEYSNTDAILHFQLEYIVVKSQALIKTKDIKMHCLFNDEMKALCKQAGLEIIKCYGDYSKSDFSPQSPKQIFVCKLEAYPN